MADRTTSCFFVYGTLKRGFRNEGVWPCEPSSLKRVWAHGTLFDRPEYPAMQSGEDRVLGELWTFAIEQMPIVLPAIDFLEGTNGNGPEDLYHRVLVPVFDLDDQEIGDAYTYHFVRDPERVHFKRMVANADGYVSWPAVTV